ncbi:Os05g0237501, partial [Oryza sativa Japonica Group]
GGVLRRLLVLGSGGGRGGGVLPEVDRLRHRRRREAPDERPVDAVEEGVLLDLGGAPGEGDPLVGLLDEQAADEVTRDGAGAAVGGEAERLLDDVAERGAVAGALERGGAVDELVEEDSQRPPVDGAAVALAADDLRGQVLVRAHERHGPRLRRLRVELHRRRAVEQQAHVALGRLAAAPRQDAREEGGGLDAALVRRHALAAVDGVSSAAYAAAAAGGVDGGGLDEGGADGAAEGEVEVGEHDVAVVPHQDVLRLEVPVHDPQHVQVLQRQ